MDPHVFSRLLEAAWANRYLPPEVAAEASARGGSGRLSVKDLRLLLMRASSLSSAQAAVSGAWAIVSARPELATSVLHTHCQDIGAASAFVIREVPSANPKLFSAQAVDAFVFPPQQRPATGLDHPVTTTRAAPGGEVHIPAHHAWAWYRERSEPPLLPAYTPELSEGPAPTFPSQTAPPTPAPEVEQIHALIHDAAAQARAHLHDAAQLECALHQDVLRLAAAVPGVRLPETAEHLGIDIADLREQISAYTPTLRAG